MSNLRDQQLSTAERKETVSQDQTHTQVSPGMVETAKLFTEHGFEVYDAGSGLLQDNFNTVELYDTYTPESFLEESLSEEENDLFPRLGIHVSAEYHDYSSSGPSLPVDITYRELQQILRAVQFQYHGETYNPEWTVFELPEYEMYRITVDSGTLHSWMFRSDSLEEYDEIVRRTIATLYRAVAYYYEDKRSVSDFSEEIFTF